MRILRTVPDGLEEIVEVYGDCYAADFATENLVWMRAPFIMRLAWNPTVRIGGFTVHRQVGPAMMDALHEILQFGGLAFLRENNYDLHGGCYNPRAKTGGKGTSTHAWGISEDWCPALGPYGHKSRMPAFIVEAFVKRGFVHGATFPVVDGMHFQACTGY